MPLERDIQNAAWLKYGSRDDVRLFRNSSGAAWIGSDKRLPNGAVLLVNPRRIHFGLCVGSSDLIGWRTVTVTPEMVGTKVAVFVAAEGKAGRRKATTEQAAFIETVRAAGGRAGVFYTTDDVERILNGEA